MIPKRECLLKAFWNHFFGPARSLARKALAALDDLRERLEHRCQVEPLRFRQLLLCPADAARCRVRDELHDSVELIRADGRAGALDDAHERQAPPLDL